MEFREILQPDPVVLSEKPAPVAPGATVTLEHRRSGRWSLLCVISPARGFALRRVVVGNVIVWQRELHQEIVSFGPVLVDVGEVVAIQVTNVDDCPGHLFVELQGQDNREQR
jgi:hypothetical protein